MLVPKEMRIEIARHGQRSLGIRQRSFSLSPYQACKMLNVTEACLRCMVDDGKVSGCHRNGKLWLSKKDVVAISSKLKRTLRQCKH